MFVLVCASTLWIKVGWDLVCGAAAVITKAISVRSRKYIVIQQNTQTLQSWFFKDERAITSSKRGFVDKSGGANRAKTYLTEAFPTYTFSDPNFFRAKNVLECRGKNIVISGCFDFEDQSIQKVLTSKSESKIIGRRGYGESYKVGQTIFLD